jgi:hypothetical protein
MKLELSWFQYISYDKSHAIKWFDKPDFHKPDFLHLRLFDINIDIYHKGIHSSITLSAAMH